LSAKSSKAQSSPKARTDAELVKQLKTAATDDKLVEAVVRLRSDDPFQIVPPAERTEEITTRLLERVKKESGQTASRYNVFRNLGSFVVSAPPTFIEGLTRQPEVVSIVANRQPGSAMIPPIKKTSSRNVSKSSTKVGKRLGSSRAVSKKSSRKPARKSAK
jgi:hypothetical protein